MKTLSEYEAEGSERHKRERETVIRGFKLIGIACNHCGAELAGEKSLLMSSPPQQNIYCPNCGWEGRRFVY
jgi:uncharacterized Zn finger protein (UPF0148 family)